MSSGDNMTGKLTDNFGTIIPPTELQVAQARRYVARQATSPADLQYLSDMLDLGGDAA